MEDSRGLILQIQMTVYLPQFLNLAYDDLNPQSKLRLKPKHAQTWYLKLIWQNLQGISIANLQLFIYYVQYNFYPWSLLIFDQKTK